MSQASPDPASSNHKDHTAPRHTQPHSSKHTAPPKPHRSLSIDIKYPESAFRTPLYALPFPHPKWSANPRTGEAYEDTTLMVEALREDLGDVRESIEDVEEMSREKKNKANEEDTEEGEKEVSAQKT